MVEIAIVYDIPEHFICGFFFILALGSGELEDIRKIKIQFRIARNSFFILLQTYGKILLTDVEFVK